ncbi:MAG TPA: hypothetical protein VFR34_10575 [Paracoccaceae bacterium]|nr:hypothetical protein [Paracoccaceae bacterium]
MLSSRSLTMASAALALGLSAPAAALAQASGDGWRGPVVFSGQALNESLQAMNDFLQARYKGEDMIASILQGTPAEADFVTVARRVSDAPELMPIDLASEFGLAIGDTSSLDLHLAAFSEEQERRGEPLFVRIALAAGGTGLDFADVAGIPPVPGEELSFGPPIWDDLTLDAHMLALFDHMVEQSARNDALSVANPVDNTGSSFDRYGEALKLF